MVQGDHTGSVYLEHVYTVMCGIGGIVFPASRDVCIFFIANEMKNFNNLIYSIYFPLMNKNLATELRSEFIDL